MRGRATRHVRAGALVALTVPAASLVPGLILVMGLSLVLAPSAPARADETPAGENCTLAVPPDNAGEEARDGVVHRIFPRRRDLSNSYMGCQQVFAPQGDRWTVAETVYIERGTIVRSTYAATKNSPAGSCRFEGGKLAEGDRRACPSPSQLPFRTLPAGCFAEVRDNGNIPGWCVLE